MRKIRHTQFLGILFWCCVSGSAAACDFCALYLGTLPNDRLHRFELLNRYRAVGGYLGLPADLPAHLQQPAQPLFKTAHAGHGASPKQEPLYHPADRQWLNTTELRATFFVHPRLSVLAVLPWVRNLGRYNGAVDRYSGMGDALLLASYYPRWKESLPFAQRIALMGGLKLPTGRYAGPDLTGVRAHLLPGSGSWDVVLGTAHLLRYRRWTTMTHLSVRLATPNPVGYRFGHALNLQQSFSYTLRYCSKRNIAVNLLPSVGLYYEHVGHDSQEGRQIRTRLQTLFATVGMDLFRKRVGLSLHYQYAVGQWTDAAQLGNGGRLIVGLQWAFRSSDLKKLLPRGLRNDKGDSMKATKVSE